MVRAAANIFTVFVFLLWGSLLWFDIGLMRNIAHYQRQWGYPDAAEIILYIVAPGVMLVLVLSIFVYFNFIKCAPWLLAGLSFISILPFFYYVVVITLAAAI